jgi:hypothetical protein
MRRVLHIPTAVAPSLADAQARALSNPGVTGTGAELVAGSLRLAEEKA